MEEKIKKIKLLAMDIDGVMTEGTINVLSSGEEFKCFDVHDGYGLVMLKRMGYKTAIITARASQPVQIRGEDLKVDRIYMDAYPKTGFYEKMLEELGVSDDEVCYMGDDFPDLPLVRRAGFGVAVLNAREELRVEADYVTRCRGGRGAVREVVELILKTQGKWEEAVKPYKE